MLLVTDGADLGSFSTLRAFTDIAKKDCARKSRDFCIVADVLCGSDDGHSTGTSAPSSLTVFSFRLFEEVFLALRLLQLVLVSLCVQSPFSSAVFVAMPRSRDVSAK